MRAIRHQTYLPGVWAGGTTRAIWADPPEAMNAPASARCWLGTALIERDASYSFFANRRRLHLPIHGLGLRLHFRDPSDEVVLKSGEPYQFDGERPVVAELVNGPVVAFNLIYHPDVRVLVIATTIGPDGFVWLPASHSPDSATVARPPIRVIYSISGTLIVSDGDDQQASLASDDTLVAMPEPGAQEAPQLVLSASGDAPAMVVLATIWLNV